MRNIRENYAAETIPQLLTNCKDTGCIGGDWNSIIHESDATRNTAQKMSSSLKRLVLKLKTEIGTLEGHHACANYLEKAVGDLLLHPAALDSAAQDALLKEVQPVFTDKDNDMLAK